MGFVGGRRLGQGGGDLGASLTEAAFEAREEGDVVGGDGQWLIATKGKTYRAMVNIPQTPQGSTVPRPSGNLISPK